MKVQPFENPAYSFKMLNQLLFIFFFFNTYIFEAVYQYFNIFLTQLKICRPFQQ